MKTYEELVADALGADFSGWDFSWLAGRTGQADPSWDYARRARELIASAERLLDMDTGGGELLASFAPLPAHAVATEAWEPNVPIARQRLAPLGCAVRTPESEHVLPADDDEFDLVLNRHGALPVPEIARILRRGGTFFTQAVGSRNCADLNEALGAPPNGGPDGWTLDRAIVALSGAGFEVVDSCEEFPAFTFYDIGAVVYQLEVVSWQIAGFDVETYDAALRALDARIRSEGAFTAHNHRFMVEARLRT